MNSTGNDHDAARPEFERVSLFESETLTVADVHCHGRCRHRSAEECTAAAQMIFPYRGVFVRHLGNDALLADSNQVLFFGAGQAHQVSHPISGGDACLVLTLAPTVLGEIAPAEFRHEQSQRFRLGKRTLDPASHGLRALLLSRLGAAATSELEAESLGLALASQAFAPLARPRRRTTRGKFHLVDRVKLLLAESRALRLSLSEIGRLVGASPVYLTQAFSELEGLPLYRYQLRLRLAQALLRLPQQQDLAALALDLGFASHSQFSTVFRQHFGLSPSDYLRTVKRPEVHQVLKILKAAPAWK